MSSGLNKEWIKDDNIGSIQYQSGICEFQEFIIKQSNHGKKYFLCPCRKCCNRSGQHPCEDILIHLLTNGMDKSYELWCHHGEHLVVNQTQNLVEHDTPIVVTEEVEENVPPTFDQQDVSHEGFVNDDPVTSDFVPGTHRETKNERLQRLARNPLYLSSEYTTMDAFLMLNDLKASYGVSDAAVKGMLGVLNKLLPRGNNLENVTYHEMKCTLKKHSIKYISYDVCANNCMLFWKEHSDSISCTKCGLSRYKPIPTVEHGRKRKRSKAVGNKNGEQNIVNELQFSNIPCKVMRYFPIIPRLQRLYSVKWIAEAMTWHYRAKTDPEYMRHPRDSVDWSNANRRWREFSRDPRSIRLALATDGFSPYGCFGSTYSCWPVIIQPLNLPPSLAMKSEFSLLTVLIPGPTSPKSSIDVFLQPLIDDLNVLWNGVDAWDEYKKESFKLKAMLLWCIHDFPAYGMLAGTSYSGYQACPICSRETKGLHLPSSQKICYLCSRMFLPIEHPWRYDTSKKTYNGNNEYEREPRKLEGSEVEKITSTFNNPTVGAEDISTLGFKRRSILFDLPYWKFHSTRHNLDLMHVEKNVTEILLSTILNLKGTKDTLKARKDLEAMKLKKKLWPIDGGEKFPPAPFVLTNEDKLTLFTTLKNLKVPEEFSASFSNSVKVGTIANMSFSFKAHDYHMVMQYLLPALLVRVYPVADKALFKAIQRISIFFNVLCAKVICIKHLEKAKVALTEALCVLETYFPPSFFVIMIHLMHHLGDEALVAGPTRFRAMWTFEREMKRYKNWANNKAHIEGSIAEAYLLHEASLYAMEYVSATGEGTHKRNRESFFDDENAQCLEQHMGTIRKVVFNTTQFIQARRWVIQAQPEYESWRTLYQQTARVTPLSTWKFGVDDFIMWLKEEAQRTSDTKLMLITNGPDFKVNSYDKFKCNGYTFSTVGYDRNKKVQNHGVSMKALNHCGIMMTYYGVIIGIYDLDYGEFTHTVFYCDWVCSDDRTAFKVDPISKLVLVNLNKVMRSDNVVDEPFILSSQASQVFYCPDSKLDGWSIVIPNPKKVTKAIDSLEIDRTMYTSTIEENERLCALLEPFGEL